MFHVSEANGGMGELTVSGGKMTVHVSLAGKKILRLYAGSAERAKLDEAHWLLPSEDAVTFSDGLSETVFGFDVPVQDFDVPFPVAIFGAKGAWHDHRVSVSLAD